MKVQWWGGPDDGATFEVAHNMRVIEIPMPPNLLDFRVESEVPSPIEFRTAIVPLSIWQGRVYAIYPKLPGKENP
jgi:hypothetical protein